MALTDAQLQTLKTELDTDPASLRYSTQDDAQVSDTIHSLETGQTVLDDNEITVQELFELFDMTEYETAVAMQTKSNTLTHLLTMVHVKLGSANIRTALVQVFGANSQTIRNLDPKRSRVADRAEVVFAPDRVRVTPSDVANARRLP